jgi:hypothetical protein
MQSSPAPPVIGQEISMPRHLADGQEFSISTNQLIAHGKALFGANWTIQEGAGRPLTKGTGAPVSDPNDPLVFPRMFNRVSALDANSCAGCHNAPFGIAGGGGDYTAGVFVLAQRFDFASMDHADPILTKGTVQENGQPATLANIGNFRASLGMFGSGYVELLAREMTEDLQNLRNSLLAGQSVNLVTKGVDFGVLARFANGDWDVSAVEGLPAPSIATGGSASPPSLIIRPFHQAGAVVSLRQFSNNAFNHHHGIQSTERFGIGADPDGDQFLDEMTRADITAVTMFQAALPLPGRVIPDDPAIEQAVRDGERGFRDIGCVRCHIPALPLYDSNFVEPGPFNPPGNLQVGQAPPLALDLNDQRLKGPRLKSHQGVTMVPVFTDLKLHDITSGPGDPNAEPLDQQQAAGSAGFFAGNRKFLTRKLWGVANEPPYFHHGQFTTMREAILNHSGEALAERQAFEQLPAYRQDAIIECLKTFQVLPPGTKYLIVNEHGERKNWP